MLAVCGADACYRDLDVRSAVAAFQSMVRQPCTACVQSRLHLQLTSTSTCQTAQMRFWERLSTVAPLSISMSRRMTHRRWVADLLCCTSYDCSPSAQRRCQCPLEVIDAIRRTVRKLIVCVDHEPDTMLVLRRRRPISSSLGTAAKPNYLMALPLLRAVAALVRGLPISNLLRVTKVFGAAVIDVAKRGCWSLLTV